MVEPEPKEVPASSGVNLNSRYYKKQYPEVDDLVMVKVKAVEDMGAYVQLLEYNKIEGLIMTSELSRRRIRSISKLIRVNKIEVAMVLRVDTNKGYIDLSKKRVSAEETNECSKIYNKSKAVNSILRHVAETTQTEIEELYENIGWPLYEQYGHAHDALRLAVNEPENVLSGLTMTEQQKSQLITIIRSRLTPKPVKIRSDFELQCNTAEGIDSIKAALRAGEACSTDKCAIKIKLISSPLYTAIMTTHQKNDGLILMNEAIARIRNEITELRGQFQVKVSPQIIGDSGEQDIEDLIAARNKEAEELTSEEEFEEYITYDDPEETKDSEA